MNHPIEGPPNNITVTINLPQSHGGGQAAFWSNSTQSIQWTNGEAWPPDGSPKLEYGFEAQAFGPGPGSDYGYFSFS